jgi:hypothetical protein
VVRLRNYIGSRLVAWVCGVALAVVLMLPMAASAGDVIQHPQFRTNFNEQGIQVVPDVRSAGAGRAWELWLRVEAWGREGDMQSVGAPSARNMSGNRVEYVRPGITEWYVNEPHGLKQGFTIEASCARRGLGLGHPSPR